MRQFNYIFNLLFADYSAFGAALNGRTFSSPSYKYGFNGMEKDQEMHGNDGDSYDFGARMYDARVGRFLSRDPLNHKYPYLSSYSFAANTPIRFIDRKGLEPGTPIPVEISGYAYTNKSVSVTLQTTTYQGIAVTAMTFDVVTMGYGHPVDPQNDPTTPASTSEMHIYKSSVTVFIDGNGNVVGGSAYESSSDFGPVGSDGKRVESNLIERSSDCFSSWGPDGQALVLSFENSMSFSYTGAAGNIFFNTMNFNKEHGVDAPDQIEKELTSSSMDPGSNTAFALAQVFLSFTPGGLALRIGQIAGALALGVSFYDMAKSEQYNNIASKGVLIIETRKVYINSSTGSVGLELYLNTNLSKGSTVDYILYNVPEQMKRKEAESTDETDETEGE